MQARKKRKTKLSSIRYGLLEGFKRLFQVVAIALLAVAVVLLLRRLSPQRRPAPADAVRPQGAALASDSSPLEERPLYYVEKKRPAYHVGIVAGHSGHDSGAVCPDGLTEVEINLAVAEEVVALLKRRDYSADLLQEFDERLPGYRADALISIHADSCDVPGASGFKVARVTESAVPQAEDRLVDCLNQEYQAYTGLSRHPNSVTDDMTNYHAFWDIDERTPGVIIEIGFMLEDRYLLVQRPKVVARGVAAGVICFLEGEQE
jgi:N-acetylmuramoyl-L-alanine amidase